MERVYWGDDDFEEVLTGAFYWLYERNILPDAKLAAPPIRLKAEDYARLKRFGLYFPARDRLCERAKNLDLRNDGLQISGVFSHLFRHKSGDSLLTQKGFKMLPKLPYGLRSQYQGYIYELTNIELTEDYRLMGAKAYAVVDKAGQIHPVYMFHQDIKKWISYDEFLKGANEHLASDPLELSFTQSVLSMTYSFWADRMHHWLVETEDEIGKVRFGVYEDEVKSLFYSRALPMTATGRKRPILHWVGAHTRRMRSGIDIDITQHLRGVSTFNMYGMDFRISQPVKPVSKSMSTLMLADT